MGWLQVGVTYNQAVAKINYKLCLKSGTLEQLKKDPQISTVVSY